MIRIIEIGKILFHHYIKKSQKFCNVIQFQSLINVINKLNAYLNCISLGLYSENTKIKSVIQLTFFIRKIELIFFFKS